MASGNTYPINAERRTHRAPQLVGKPSVFRQFTGFVRYALSLASLETAQNHKVWASRFGVPKMQSFLG